MMPWLWSVYWNGTLRSLLCASSNSSRSKNLEEILHILRMFRVEWIWINIYRGRASQTPTSPDEYLCFLPFNRRNNHPNNKHTTFGCSCDWFFAAYFLVSTHISSRGLAQLQMHHLFSRDRFMFLCQKYVRLMRRSSSSVPSNGFFHRIQICYLFSFFSVWHGRSSRVALFSFPIYIT